MESVHIGIQTSRVTIPLVHHHGIELSLLKHWKHQSHQEITKAYDEIRLFFSGWW